MIAVVLCLSVLCAHAIQYYGASASIGVSSDVGASLVYRDHLTIGLLSHPAVLVLFNIKGFRLLEIGNLQFTALGMDNGFRRVIWPIGFRVSFAAQGLYRDIPASPKVNCTSQPFILTKSRSCCKRTAVTQEFTTVIFSLKLYVSCKASSSVDVARLESHNTTITRLHRSDLHYNNRNSRAQQVASGIAASVRSSKHIKAQSKERKTITMGERTLACTSISCGLWDYQLGIVFKPYFTLTESAEMTFKSKSIVFTTDSSQRLDISYHTIEAVAYESLSIPAMAITLREAPRFFESSDRAISMQDDPFGIRDMLREIMPYGPAWKRLTGLDTDHKKIAGSCLVYRIVLNKETTSYSLLKSLSEFRGMPRWVWHHIYVDEPQKSYMDDFKQLLLQLAPTATPLPFAIRFQLQKLAQNGYLPPSKVVQLLPEIKRIFSRSGQRVGVDAIRKLFLQLPFAGPDVKAAYFDLKVLEQFLRRNENISNRDGLYFEVTGMSERLAVIHKATVTPAGIYLYGPDRESNNRILRKYPNNHDSFLRVQFCDEDGLQIYSNRDASAHPLFDKFRNVLNKGFDIAGQHFDFLGFSHSSLRTQSCWFMAPFDHNGSRLDDRMVINDLGNFSHIRSPARCAARIGQAFTDTRDAITLDPEVVKEMPDVERNGRVFSDGVGTISMEALEQIWDGLLHGKRKPTVLQIRYQGAKGMIALDSRLKGKSVFLRPSMIKFRESNSADLEICRAAYKPLPLYLNRQMIKILEDMGVDDAFFTDLQEKEVQRLRLATSSAINASRFLRSHSVGDKINLPWFIEKLSNLQLSFRDDKFLANAVEAAVLIELRALKYKARIPVKDGFTLLGIMDETGILEEGQIFCIVDIDGKAKVITKENNQKVIITRSPALHPGDVQRATAVTVPEDSPLMRLRNCICFSQKGLRDLPSQLSGGDLDGDDFHIIFDSNAQCKVDYMPAEYAKQNPLVLNRQVERKDMTEFFVKFMETDQLGRICVIHEIIADNSSEGVRDKGCILLSKMASTAVDYSKTGIPPPTQFPRYPRERPDFMAPGPHVKMLEDKPIFENSEENTNPNEEFNVFTYYPSKKILGKLFRAIDERSIFENVQQNKPDPLSDRNLDHGRSVPNGVWSYVIDCYPEVLWRKHLDRARSIRGQYEESLFDLMLEYGPHPHKPLSEVEVFVGNILSKAGAQTKRQRDLSISMKERFEESLSLTVRYITKSDNYSHDEGNEDTNGNENRVASEEALAVSMACLWVAVNEKAGVWKYGKRGRVELRSFRYVAAAVCLKEAENSRG